jgi:hypothetical protein
LPSAARPDDAELQLEMLDHAPIGVLEQVDAEMGAGSNEDIQFPWRKVI